MPTARELEPLGEPYRPYRTVRRLVLLARRRPLCGRGRQHAHPL